MDDLEFRIEDYVVWKDEPAFQKATHYILNSPAYGLLSQPVPVRVPPAVRSAYFDIFDSLVHEKYMIGKYLDDSFLHNDVSKFILRGIAKAAAENETTVHLNISPEYVSLFMHSCIFGADNQGNIVGGPESGLIKTTMDSGKLRTDFEYLMTFKRDSGFGANPLLVKALDLVNSSPVIPHLPTYAIGRLAGCVPPACSDFDEEYHSFDGFFDDSSSDDW